MKYSEWLEHKERKRGISDKPPISNPEISKETLTRLIGAAKRAFKKGIESNESIVNLYNDYNIRIKKIPEEKHALCLYLIENLNYHNNEYFESDVENVLANFDISNGKSREIANWCYSIMDNEFLFLTKDQYVVFRKINKYAYSLKGGVPYKLGDYRYTLGYDNVIIGQVPSRCMDQTRPADPKEIALFITEEYLIKLKRYNPSKEVFDGFKDRLIKSLSKVMEKL